MAKSPDAFRTISEVADWLGVQAHVLRFWESKFAQVKPIKRAGGRRYYRPSDMLLLGGLKKILHEDGLTIKGAQKLLREKGVGYVADLSQPLDDLTIAVIEGSGAPVEMDAPQDTQDVIDTPADADTPEETSGAPPRVEDAPAEPAPSEPEQLSALSAEDKDEDEDEDETAHEPDPVQSDTSQDIADADVLPSFRARPRDTARPQDTLPDAAAPQDEDDAGAESDPAPTAPPKPKRIDVTLIHDHTRIEAEPSALSKVSAIRQLSAEHARQIRPLLARLTRLRASMANPRKDLRKD